MLAVLAALASLAAVAQPNGGYYPGQPADERGNGAADDVRPLRWVDQSRQEFQRLMRLLAKRSARLHSPPEPTPAQPSRQEPDWDWRPMPPARPARWEPEENERRPLRRGPELERARHPVWPPRTSARCRRAGVPVEGGGWYVVAPGDTLWRIAEAHYGDGRTWRRIVEANRGRLPEPSCIHACQRLFIPRWGQEWPVEERRPREERPLRDNDEPWVRPAAPPRSIEPASAEPRGCTDCGAGSHVSARNGNGRGDDREWR